MNYLILSYHIDDLGLESLARYNYQGEDLKAFLTGIKQDLAFSEVMYLATCNRVEFLFFTTDIEQLFASLASIKGLELNGARIFSEQTSVIHHLLEVALSMDSVIFGEYQILGQLKDAYLQSLKDSFSSNQITKLIQYILKYSKKIRTQHQYASIHNSFASLAAKDYCQNFTPENKVLLVGAGESNQLFARYLSKRGYKNISWCNRTKANAVLVQQQIGGSVVDWQDFLVANLDPYDAIVLTTSAGKEILSEDCLESISPSKVYDLSLPANADRELVKGFGASYIGIEEIKEELQKEEIRYQETKSKLKLEIAKAVTEIDQLLEERAYDPIISESLQSMDQILNSAMGDLPRELSNLNQDQLVALKSWTHSLIQKTKHEHIARIKSIGPLKKTK